ncbi:Uncharacterized protein dnl_59480 [Desulfonema limicola]|uniref:Uncharacterized protein n=1 Tax=Desulfonema limicola TaxID=45656 RepID=A0A975BDP2_9BACT|nr:Uncharacterized protein dnl_59480 [Desulfonema limicola]
MSEQFIGQQLMASISCYEDKKLYFWTREKKTAMQKWIIWPAWTLRFFQ